MKNICVFTGSNPGRQEAFQDAARLLGRELTQREIGLVYGGAKVGLMGLIADTVLAQGGRVVGVLPSALVEKEVAHPGLSDLHVVDSMHTRKALMAELSDGFIALPGGFGTLDEIFEVITWAQLGLHKKPCGFLNVDGYYDGLLSFLKTAVNQGFVKKEHLAMLIVEASPAKLLDRFDTYVAPEVEKWLKPEEDIAFKV